LITANEARDSGLDIRLIGAFYSNSISCALASQSESAWFTIESVVGQGCVLAPDSLATGLEWDSCK